MRGRQRLLRDPRRPARGRSGRGPLPGHLRGRPLQPGRDRDRRAHGRERGPGQRPQLAAAAVPGRRRALVRRRGSRGAGAPAGAGPAPGHPDPRPALAGPDGPPHQRGPAPAGQHEGPASGRPGDDLHGRELVGDDASSLRPGRPGGQRGGQALPRPERPAPAACCTPARRTPRRSSCRPRPTSRTCGSPWPPAPGCSATARPSRPIGGWSPNPASSPTSSPSSWRRGGR